jgi:colanic acid biosynthesis glycosyl transferase WcaI
VALGGNCEGKVRILFINQCYWPDYVASAQHLTDLAEELASRGHEVTVLCSRNPHSGGERVFCRKERRHGVMVRRVPTLRYGKTSGVNGRAMQCLSFHIAALVKALWLPRPDVVVTLTSPQLVGVLGWLLMRLKGIRHVHWCMDLFPDTAVVFGVLKENGLVHRLCRGMVRRYMGSASGVVVLDRHMAARVAHYGVSRRRLHVVPVWADGREITPISHAANWFREKHQLQGRFVVMFSGNLEPGAPVETMVEAAGRLQQDPDVVFVLIGGGPSFEKVRRLKDRASVHNMILLPYQDRGVLAYSLSAGDVHLVTNRRGLSGLRVPSKTYGILAAGRPLIYLGDPESETVDLIRDYQIGCAVEENDVDGLIAAIRRLKGDEVLRRKSLERTRAVFEARYDSRPAIDLFERTVGEIMNSGMKKNRDTPHGRKTTESREGGSANVRRHEDVPGTT